MDVRCGLSDAVGKKEAFGYESEAVMEHSLLHSYDSGFHHSAKFVGCCVSERYATAFLFLQQRWTTTVLQSVLTFRFLVSAFWLKIVGSCLCEADAKSTTRRTSSDAVPLAFLVRCRCIAPSVLGWTFQHGTTTPGGELNSGL